MPRFTRDPRTIHAEALRNSFRASRQPYRPPTEEFVVCSHCHQQCDWHREENPNALHSYDAASNCCHEPILSSITGQELTPFLATKLQSEHPL